MARNYRLVRARGEWQVCSKARRLDASGQPYICWIYGPARLEFCRVNETEVVLELPGVKTNFHGDQFAFTVERRHASEERWERVAGSINILAANKAFEIMTDQPGSRMLYRVRHGSRIIQESSLIDHQAGSG